MSLENTKIHTIYKVSSPSSGYYLYKSSSSLHKVYEIKKYINSQAKTVKDERYKLLFNEEDRKIEIITNLPNCNESSVKRYIDNLIGNVGLQPLNSKCLNIDKVEYKEPTNEEVKEQIIQQNSINEQVEDKNPIKIINPHLLNLIKSTNNLINIRNKIKDTICNYRPKQTILVDEYDVNYDYKYRELFNHYKEYLGYRTIDFNSKYLTDIEKQARTNVENRVTEELIKNEYIRKVPKEVDDDRTYRDINLSNINDSIVTNIKYIEEYLVTTNNNTNKYFIKVMSMLNIKITGDNMTTYKEYTKLKNQFSRYMIDNDLLTLIRSEFKELYYKNYDFMNSPNLLISQFDWSSIYYDYILYEEEQHYNRLINEAQLIPLDILKEKYAKMVIVEDKEDEKEEYKRLKREDKEQEREWRRSEIDIERYYSGREENEEEYDEGDDD